MNLSINFDKNSLEEIRETATRMWIDETRPTDVDPRSANVFYIVKAFCEINKINIEYNLNRKSTEAIDDIN